MKIHTKLRREFHAMHTSRGITILIVVLAVFAIWSGKLPKVQADSYPFTSYTSKVVNNGTTIYVTVIPQGHKVTAQIRNTEPWWKWGNTSSDIYLFAIGQPSNVEMILEFRKNASSVPEATLYADTAGNQPISYQWVQSPLEKATNSPPSLKILSFKGVQSIVISPTKGDYWVSGGRPNYHLKFTSDSHAADRPSRIDIVTPNSLGIPKWQTSTVTKDLHPKWSYNRFNAYERMPGAPPFQVQSTFMPTFPYIGIHDGDPNWFVANPNPFYFNIKRMKFTAYPFVGFKEGGIYQLGSVSPPPHLDFESPFAFYNFAPNTRYAQLVVRAQNYNANDPFFYYPTPKELMTYRYSWAMKTDGLWDYGLTVGGFRSFHTLQSLGSTKFYGVPSSKLPKWVINHNWGTVTLNQAMNGYPGSEGIYFYSVQSPDMWKWMLGYLNDVPYYLSHPRLTNRVELTTTSTTSVPLGFRDEYNATYFRSPVLYASPIDKLMHLKWATGGIYHFSKKEIIKTDNLNGGPYIDSWEIQRIPTYKLAAQLVYLDGYLLYSGQKGVVIRKVKINQDEMTISPPTNKPSWQQYVKKVQPYQKGQDPTNLYNWMKPFLGDNFRLSHGSISDLKVTSGGFSFLITSSSAPGTTQIVGLPTRPGKFMIHYDATSHKWSYTKAYIPSLSGNVQVLENAQVGHVSRYILSVRNKGNVPWHGKVTLNINGQSYSSKELTIGGGQVSHSTVTRTPESSGVVALELGAGNQVLWKDAQVIGDYPTKRDSFTFHLGWWSYIIDIFSLLCILLLAWLSVRMLGYTFRNVDEK